MSRENPPYITIVVLYGIPHVNLMEWDKRADTYLVVISKQCDPTNAQSLAEEWAEKEGYDIR